MDLMTRQAYCEVNEFLESIDKDSLNKIPEKLRDFFKREMDKSYKPTIDLHKPELQRKTLAIIAGLYLQYLCNDDKKKDYLLKKYSQNSVKYTDELNEIYNYDNIFKNTKKHKNTNQTIGVLIMNNNSTSLFKRVILRIKRFFTKGNTN